MVNAQFKIEHAMEVVDRVLQSKQDFRFSSGRLQFCDKRL
jgi:hypothetical protein